MFIKSSIFFEVIKTVDQGLTFDIVYNDFTRAFDKVPRAGLVNKLISVGISGHLLKWIT